MIFELHLSRKALLLSVYSDTLFTMHYFNMLSIGLGGSAFNLPGAVTSFGKPPRSLGMAGSLLEPRVAGHRCLLWLRAKDALLLQSRSASPLSLFCCNSPQPPLAAAEQRSCCQAPVTPRYRSLVTSHSFNIKQDKLWHPQHPMCLFEEFVMWSCLLCYFLFYVRC